MVGLAESLALMKGEGLQAMFARHDRMARACRAGVQALGCTLFAQSPASGVTAVVPPAGLSGKQVVSTLQSALNLTIVGGQDAIKEKVFRVAHMGYFDDMDMLTLLACVEQVCGPPRASGLRARRGCGASGLGRRLEFKSALTAK